jgi:hypothetical protein
VVRRFYRLPTTRGQDLPVDEANLQEPHGGVQ